MQVDSVNGKFGITYIADCLDAEVGLPALREKFDLCITDPPYNVELSANSQSILAPSPVRVAYADNKPETEYIDWCKTWFKECQRLSKLQVLSPGHPNIANWIKYIGEPRDYLLHYKPDGHGIGVTAYYFRGEIWFVYGEFIQKARKPFHHNLLIGNLTYTRFKRKDFKLKHPCPKSYDFCRTAIQQSRAQSIIEPFAGSGTIPEIAEELGIKYIAFEINPEYKHDIQIRVENGILNHKNLAQKTRKLREI